MERTNFQKSWFVPSLYEKNKNPQIRFPRKNEFNFFSIVKRKLEVKYSTQYLS